MKAGHRLILIGYSLLVIAIVVVFALILCGAFGLIGTIGLITAIQNSTFYTIGIIAVAAVLFVLSIAIMFLGAGKGSIASTIIKSTEHGNIRVSLDTIDSIALKTVKGLNSVRDAKINSINTETGLVINIRVALMNNAIIPDVTAEIQSVVKNHVESIVGLMVAGVPILVDNSIVQSN